MVPASDQRPAPVVVTPLSPPFPSRRRTDGRTATATAGQETGPGRPTFRVSKPRALLRLPSRNRAVTSLWPWPWPGVGERVTELLLQSHACLAPRTCTSTTALWHVEGGTQTTSSPHPLIWKHHGRRQRGPPSSHSHSHSHTPADKNPPAMARSTRAPSSVELELKGNPCLVKAPQRVSKRSSDGGAKELHPMLGARFCTSPCFAARTKRLCDLALVTNTGQSSLGEQQQLT